LIFKFKKPTIALTETSSRNIYRSAGFEINIFRLFNNVSHPLPTKSCGVEMEQTPLLLLRVRLIRELGGEGREGEGF